jgi:hypothetical protein
MEDKEPKLEISLPHIKPPLAFLAGIDELASYYVNAIGSGGVTDEEVIAALRYYADMLENQ